MAFVYAGQPCEDPAALADECAAKGLPLDWVGKPNAFVSPLGRGPGYGWLLMTLGRMLSTGLKTDGDLAVLDDAGNERTLTRITLVRGRCLTPGSGTDTSARYLCYVEDRRRFLKLVPVNKAYNLSNENGTGYLSDTTDGDAPWTWQGIVDDLWDTLGLGASAPALPYTFTGPPENLAFWGRGEWGEGAWDALHTILDWLGCTTQLDHEADAFSVVRLGDPAAAAESRDLTARLSALGLRTWDAAWFEPDRAKLVEKLRVVFPRRPQKFAATGESPVYTVDATLPATDGVEPGTYVEVSDGLAAVGTGTPTNLSALTTRADERATGWRLKRLGYEARLTTVYRDFQDGGTLLGPTVGTILYDDRGGPMRTELDSRPDGAMERFRPFDTPPTFKDVAVEARLARLTGSGDGPDGETAWAGKAQKEDGTGTVVDGDDLGPEANRNVIYMTKAADGSEGNPEVDDIVLAVPDPARDGVYIASPKPATSLNDCAKLAHVDPEDTECLTFSTGAGTGGCQEVEPQSTTATGDKDSGSWTADDLIVLPTGNWRLKYDKPTCDTPDGKLTATREDAGPGSGSSGSVTVECGVFGGCRGGSYVFTLGGKVVCGKGGGGQPAFYMVCLGDFTDDLSAYNAGMKKLEKSGTDHWATTGVTAVSADLTKAGDTYTLTVHGPAGDVVYSGAAPDDYADAVDLTLQSSPAATAPDTLTLITPGVEPCDPGTLEILVACCGGTITTPCGSLPSPLCLTVLEWDAVVAKNPWTGDPSTTFPGPAYATFADLFPDVFFAGRRVELKHIHNNAGNDVWAGSFYVMTQTIGVVGDSADGWPLTWPFETTPYMQFYLWCDDAESDSWRLMVVWSNLQPGGLGGFVIACASFDPVAMQVSYADPVTHKKFRAVISAGSCGADQPCAKPDPFGSFFSSQGTNYDVACGGLITAGSTAGVSIKVGSADPTTTTATWSGSGTGTQIVVDGVDGGSLRVFWRHVGVPGVPDYWSYEYTPPDGRGTIFMDPFVAMYSCQPPVFVVSLITNDDPVTTTTVVIQTRCADVVPPGPPPPPPPPANWDCVDGVCVGRADTSGAYPTLSACVAGGCSSSPPPPPPPPPSKWRCTTNAGFGNRICVQDPDGAYDTLADCEAAGCGPPSGCAACDLIGQSATVHVPDGPNAGDWTGTWAAAPGTPDTPLLVVTVVPTGKQFAVNCSFNGPSDPSPTASANYDGGGPINGTVDSSGPPAVFSFPGNLFSGLGATGPVTVTT
jgi:hypothetical protein